MTEATKAVMIFSAPNVKVFTFDGATLIVSRGVHQQAGPGVELRIVDSNNPGNVHPDGNGVKVTYATGGNFNPARQRLFVAAAREGMDLEDVANHDNFDWQRVQDLGDKVIDDMIAEFDEEEAEAEINGFREVEPTDPTKIKGGDLMDVLASILR